MRNFLFIQLFIFTSNISIGQENNTIINIREDFQKWQSIIDVEQKGAAQLYHYAWGMNHLKEEWSENPLADETKFLFQKVTVIEKNNLGTFV